MKRLMPIALLTALLLGHAAPSPAAAPVADEAIFVEGTRYDAVFNGPARRWRLLPAQGREVRLRVADTCHLGSAPPPGLWLLTRDGQGQPTLVAPSATVLPQGHPGTIRLLDCDQALPDAVPALAVPRSLLDWLTDNSGSIYVPR